jgi:hypothetical protein
MLRVEDKLKVAFYTKYAAAEEGAGTGQRLKIDCAKHKSPCFNDGPSMGRSSARSITRISPAKDPTQNVWPQLGIPDAEEHYLKAELVLRLYNTIEALVPPRGGLE